MADTTCSVPGCGRNIINGRGWCQTHYKRWRAGRDMNAPINTHRPAGMTLAETFRHFMPEDPPPEGIVWPWSAALDRNGYGYFRFGGRIVWAHRVAYELFREPIPEGLVIRHKNDVPHDVNPWNMEIGTQTDNMADMYARGRNAPGDVRAMKLRGSLNHGAKVSEDDVREIRRAYASGEWTLERLGIRYGMTMQGIAAIVKRKTWKHVA